MGTPQHVPLLTQALNDTEVGVRERAAMALAKVGGENGLMALVTTLHEGSMEAAEAVAAALAVMGEEEAIAALVEAATGRTEPPVLRQVAHALRKFEDDERSRQALRVLAGHPDAKVRDTARSFLGEDDSGPAT
jgi:HEAT repeat protein